MRLVGASAFSVELCAYRYRPRRMHRPALRGTPMTARELMKRKFEVIHADASLEEVARKMESSGIDPLPVCKDGLLVGLISHREIAVRAAPERRRTEPIRVS